MKKTTFILILFISILANAQKNVSDLNIEEQTESACRKIEEKLYINSGFNQSINQQNYVDSIKYCMGESVDFSLVTGRYYYYNNEYKASIIEFEKVIKASTTNLDNLGEAYYYLGLSYYYMDEYKTSIEYSKQALKLDYKTSWTYNSIGLAIAATGDWRAAHSNFIKSLIEDPSNDVAAGNLGWLYSHIHNDEKALKYYMHADSLVNGKKPIYISNIIRSLEKLQRDKEALQIAQKAYQIFPNDKNIIEDYSKFLYQEQKFEEVLPLARKLLQLNPSNANDWHSIAYIYEKAGKIDSAFYFYKLCLKYEPKNATANYNISLIYKVLGLLEKAHEYVDIALSIDPNNHFYYSGKVEMYNWQHDFENAYLWSLKFKEQFPELQYEYKIGYSLQQLKRYSEAIPFLRKALSHNPNEDRLLNNIGRCYAELGYSDSALIYFNNALTINPNNSFTYHNRAALYYDLEKYDLACQDLEQAISKEYNWIIDDKLIKMKEKYCFHINTNIQVLIFGYKGINQQLSKYSFINLSDTLLNESIDLTIKESNDLNFKKEESQTMSNSNSFNLYPNPTTGQFFIETYEIINERLTIKIYNTEGKLVLLENMTEGNKKSLDLSSVTNGIYVVLISNENSILSSKRMIIENN